jgi:hypothetical protein
VDDDSGFSAGVFGLDGNVIDPSGEVEAGVIFHLNGRETFIGYPNIAAVQIRPGRNTLGFEASDVEIVGDCSFGC